MIASQHLLPHLILKLFFSLKINFWFVQMHQTEWIVQSNRKWIQLIPLTFSPMCSVWPDSWGLDSTVSGGMHRCEFYPAGCWVCWVSVERSAAAAWPRSHSSQAWGIDRPVIKSGALVGLCAAHCSPSKARGCCLLSPICIIQRHRSSQRKGPHSGILLPLFCFANFQLK